MDLDKRYDYVIVGPGPGGATLAKELADRSRSVLVIEVGPRITGTGLWTTGRKVHTDREGKYTRSDGGIWIGGPRVLGGASYLLVRDIEGDTAARPSLAFQLKTLLKAQRIEASRLLGMMTKVGMPPILTIVALSKRPAVHLLS